MNVLALVVGSVAAALVADAFVSGRVERCVKARRRLRGCRPTSGVTQAVREAELRLPQQREELALYKAQLKTFIRLDLPGREAQTRNTIDALRKQIAADEVLVLSQFGERHPLVKRGRQ